MVDSIVRTNSRIGKSALILVFVCGTVLIGAAEGLTRTDRANGSAAVPAAQLHQNYPNPFNPRTMIPFSLERKTRVTLCVFDDKGQWVKTLVDRELAPGMYMATWNGRDEAGTAVRAGVYYYKLRADNTFNQGKAIVMK